MRSRWQMLRLSKFHTEFEAFRVEDLSSRFFKCVKLVHSNLHEPGMQSACILTIFPKASQSILFFSCRAFRSFGATRTLVCIFFSNISDLHERVQNGRWTQKIYGKKAGHNSVGLSKKRTSPIGR